MIKGIIFDCDGTLVDSEILCSQALEAEFARYGIRYPAEEMMHRYRGVKLDEILREMAEQNGVALNNDFEANYRARIPALFESKLRACVGVAEALKSINLPIAVASSGPVTKMQLSLGITGLLSYFSDRLISSYDLGVWKPEPDIFLHAAQTLTLKPSQCIVVEDSNVGIQAAKSAGMTAVLFAPHGLSPTRPQERHQSQVTADFVIGNMLELMPLIDRINTAAKATTIEHTNRDISCTS